MGYFASLANSFVGGVKSVGETIGGGVSDFLDWNKNASDNLKSGIQDFGEGFIDYGKTLIGGTKNETVFPDGSSTGVTVPQKVTVEDVKEKVKDDWEDLKETPSEIIDATPDPIQNFVEGFIDYGKTLIGGTKNETVFPDGSSTGVTVPQKVTVEDVKEKVKDDWDDIKEIPDKIENSVISGGTRIVNNALEAVKDVGSTIGSNVKKYAPYAILGVGAIVALKLSSDKKLIEKLF